MGGVKGGVLRRLRLLWICCSLSLSLLPSLFCPPSACCIQGQEVHSGVLMDRRQDLAQGADIALQYS